MTREEVRRRRQGGSHDGMSDLLLCLAAVSAREEHSLVYVKGLLSNEKRKSIEPVALQFARGPQGAVATQNEVVALQGFITYSPWKEADVFQEIQAVFTEELIPTSRPVLDWRRGRDR